VFQAGFIDFDPDSDSGEKAIMRIAVRERKPGTRKEE